MELDKFVFFAKPAAALLKALISAILLSGGLSMLFKEKPRFNFTKRNVFGLFLLIYGAFQIIRLWFFF